MLEEELKAAAWLVIKRLACCVDAGKGGASCRGELEEEDTLLICLRLMA
jgi:hypothetical protein